MMQCREKNGRFNNGFRKTETKKEYQDRLINLIDQICDWILEDLKQAQAAQKEPSIIGGLFAEFAIEKNDSDIWISHMRERKIPGWENPHFHTTSFGVTKIFKNDMIAQNTFFEDETIKKTLDIELHNRITTYRTSEAYQISNVHIPFQNPKESYKKILRPILRDMIKNNPSGFRCHDICGDKNLSYQEEMNAIREAWQETLQELQNKKGAFTPVTITIDLKLSENGHLKDVNGKQSYYQVDSALRIIATQSKTNQNEFFDMATGEKIKYGALALGIGATCQFFDADINALIVFSFAITMLIIAYHNQVIDREFLFVHEGSHHHSEQPLGCGSCRI
jgi:hypothetical protein